MALAIKRIHNLPPYLPRVSYVSTLPEITQRKCCLPISSVSGS